jgi:hypothetical protein
MANILYTIGCPKCMVLEKKLSKAGISYEICRNEDIMGQKNISNLPTLEVDGALYSFKEAVDWINGGK